jgi:hypothetical protein
MRVVFSGAVAIALNFRKSNEALKVFTGERLKIDEIIYLLF